MGFLLTGIVVGAALYLIGAGMEFDRKRALTAPPREPSSPLVKVVSLVLFVVMTLGAALFFGEFWNAVIEGHGW